MTSEPRRHGFVWVWLPGRQTPVVAGRVDDVGPYLTFTYGRSYLARDDAMPLYLPELPLVRGPQKPPAPPMVAPGCIRDAAPDSWGQRIILHRLRGRASIEDDTSQLPLLTYLLEAGSDRIGAIDLQDDPEVYTPRGADATLEEMLTAADRLQAGEPLSPELERALLPGSSVGGARPKTLLTAEDGRQLVAKFSSPTETFPWIPAEAVAMELARRAGLDVPDTEQISSLGHDVLLVERFDRVPGTRQRHMVVSGLTLLGLDELHVRYGSYPELADVIRRQFRDPKATLTELFSRIVFNVLVGNTDDHPRNHAALWDGQQAVLAPAYDIAPQPRAGGEVAQAMEIGRNGERLSRLEVCLDAAGAYLLDAREAREIIDRLVTVVHEQWADSCDHVGLTDALRQRLWGRQVCNPYAFTDYRGAHGS